jgi:hypothetical protein
VSDLPGPTSEFLARYLVQIRDRMIDLFGISAEEAEGRIASEFGSFDLVDLDTERYFGHEDPDYWAHSVCYGVDAQWWRASPEELRPTPWP